MIKGVLFDMDGVLADSEQYICKAATMMFAGLGFTVEPQDFKPFVEPGKTGISAVLLKNMELKWISKGQRQELMKYMRQ